MKVRELVEKIGAQALSGEENLDAEITCGYSCDLLSWVLAHGKQGMGYQRHFHATGFGNFPQCGRIRQRGRVDRERVERHQRGGEQGHHACGAHGDGTGQPGLHLWLHAVPRP